MHVSSAPARRSLRIVARHCGLFLLVLLGAALTSTAIAAPPFVVNTGSTDLDDKMPGDGNCADVNGMCSLRAAIDEANALPGGPYAITFAPSASPVLVINGGLPSITAPVLMTGPAVINGTGNAFAHGCLDLEDSNNTTGNYPNGATNSLVTLLTIINCSGDGIVANGHGYHIVGNLLMNNAGNGIIVSASHTYGNFVDADALDMLFQSFPAQPVQGSDINTFVQNLATKLVTLNPITISGNVISGNGSDGINIHSENLGAVFVSGNMIGTDPTGNIANGNGGAGVHINAFAFGNVIGPGNVISGNTGNGVTVDSPTVYLPNFIMGNRIGLAATDSSQHIGNGMNGIFTSTAPDGSVANKNPSGTSLIIGPANLVSDNQGAASSSDPDTLSSEAAGIYITGTSNGVKVMGNTIGIAEFPAGTPIESKAYGNAGDGIVITATGNTIGGSSAGSGNIIAGNARHGILVSTTNNTSTHILGNTIGIHSSFASDLTLGNGFDGIHIDAASSTYVGGTGTSDFNVIAGNGRNGVKIRNGDLLNGWSNLVQRNQIYANAQGNPAAMPVALPPGVGVGIDLDHVDNASDGPHDEFPASYANLDQAPPVICSGAGGEPAECAGFAAPKSVAGMTTFDWTLKTHTPASFRVEFFQINAADDNAATGMTFLGEQPVTTDANGLPAGCPGGRCTATIAMNTAGSYVLMTVTDITDLLATAGNLGDWKNSLTCFVGDLGVILSACTVNDTSEFSNVVTVPDSNADLSGLSISSGMLMPAFVTTTLDYTDAVPSGVSSVTVTPTVADMNATVTVNGTTVTSGNASGAITLNAPGSMTAIMIVITAPDGTTTKTYTVTVNRAGVLSNNATLNNLSISSGTLMPSFLTTTLGYTDAVASGVSSVTVTPTLADANASMTVNGSVVANGAASGAISLNAPGSMTTIMIVVTAQDGTTTQTYTVSVNRAGVLSNNAGLNNLSISNGTLTPAFLTTTLGYTDAVASGVSSLTVTPTVADANATVKVNGTTVASGNASGAITLNAPGSMTAILVVVTAQDGSTTQTYTVTVNRAGVLSNNASLNNLSISNGTLTPSFLTTTLSYTEAVASGTSSVTVTPTVADANATVKVNGTTVASGNASGAITLNAPGSMTTIMVVVTAQDGTTVQTYTIVVNRAGAFSNNANLNNLAISNGTLTPSFLTTTLSYTDAVTSGVSSLTVTPTVADANATVKVNGTAVASGNASGAITLNAPGSMTTIMVVVTAQDGTTTQTYTIVVNRAGALSNNANLNNLSISNGSLTPAFLTTTLAYTDAVTSGVSSLTVTPTVADANATVKVNGTAVASGNASGTITLNAPGSMTTIMVVVTAQDGTTTQTYTIVVNRAGALSNNANLNNLSISSGSLTPAFLTTTLAYTDAVTSGVSSLTVTPIVADANATVKVNGTTVASGNASAAITLNAPGSMTTILVVVTAQDTTTTQTYTIVVNRAGALSNNASLSTLAISNGSLTPSFVTTTLSYTDAVASGVSSLTVTPTVMDANAIVEVNGTTVTSGNASGAISLNAPGSMTTIMVAVTAQDTTTTQTYTIVVNRAGALSNNANLNNLSISNGSLTPAFLATTLGYADAVASGVSSLTVTPTVADANATVTVNGTAVTSGNASGAITLNAPGSMTTILVVVTAQDGTTTQTYTIVVNRAGALSNNASLGNLSISSGSLTPFFAGATLNYTDAVASGVTSVTVTPTLADANASVKVNGTTVTSGNASSVIGLIPGMNTITLLVTAQDTTTTQVYTVIVNRASAVVTTFSGTTFTNTGTGTAVLSGGGANCSFGSAAFVGPPIAPPAGVTFPDGLFQFTAVNCVGSITITATFPTVFSGSEQYWKYGPTPGPVAAHWYTLGGANNLVLSGKTATFTIADGGQGDDDLTVNASIVDQGGPGVPAASAPGNGVTPTPTLSAWALWLLSTLLALAGVAGAHKHRQRGAR